MDHFYQNIEGCFTFAEFYTHVVQCSGGHWHGVEVGSMYGQSAAYLAAEFAIWIDTCDNNGVIGPSPRLDLVELSDNRVTLLSNLARVSHVIGTIHSPCSSVTASNRYDNGSLNFVMLDAGHDYADVRSDIDAWWPKVKTGGILAGHDFSHYFPGVMRAALESFPRLQVWAGSEWPDDTVKGKRLDDAARDIRARSALHIDEDFMPVWWVRK